MTRRVAKGSFAYPARKERMDDGFDAARRPIECALWLTRLCMDTTGEAHLDHRGRRDAPTKAIRGSGGRAWHRLDGAARPESDFRGMAPTKATALPRRFPAHETSESCA
jgi:hypothetical protein